MVRVAEALDQLCPDAMGADLPVVGGIPVSLYAVSLAAAEALNLVWPDAMGALVHIEMRHSDHLPRKAWLLPSLHTF